MFKNFIIILPMAFLLVVGQSYFVKGEGVMDVECKDGKAVGLDELVKSIEETIANCRNVTTSQLDLFGCIFKRLSMFSEDGDGAKIAEKVKGFFKKVGTKLMDGAKDLNVELTGCAKDYSKAFESMKSAEDWGKGGDTFAKCFKDASTKFSDSFKENCKA